MGAYSDMVSGTFSNARKGLAVQTGQDKELAKSAATQANLAGGITGPVGAALTNKAVRGAANAGNQALLGLGTQERQAQYDAFTKDRAEAIQSDTANRGMWMQGLSGAGALLGGIASLIPGADLAKLGVDAVTGIANTAQNVAYQAEPRNLGMSLPSQQSSYAISQGMAPRYQYRPY